MKGMANTFQPQFPFKGIVAAMAQMGFNPRTLFANNEPGVWYDPSDLSTLYQDSAGTTPVTAVEQPVGLMLDKSGRGNHASQPTATSRPVLSARVNLLTKTEQFDDAVWSNKNATIVQNAVTAPNGTMTADKLVETNVPGPHQLFQSATFTTNVDHVFSCYAKAAERTKIRLHWNGTSSALIADVDLSTGAVLGGTSVAVTDAGNGWWRIAKTMQRATNNALCVALLDSSRDALYQGDGTSGIYIWGADLRVANDGANLPPYQRVNTATDYDTVGFPHYLRFDGVDDWLVTNTITPGTDKAQVFAGVRKMSDATDFSIVGLSQDPLGIAGVLELFRGSGASDKYVFRSKGTTSRFAVTTEPAAPITNTLTGLGDISGDSAILRVNGTQAAQSTADQGAGNFQAYPLYIGRRGGTTLSFNGHLYGLIVRFGPNLPAATIEKTEKYINSKTRAY